MNELNGIYLRLWIFWFRLQWKEDGTNWERSRPGSNSTRSGPGITLILVPHIWAAACNSSTPWFTIHGNEVIGHDKPCHEVCWILAVVMQRIALRLDTLLFFCAATKEFRNNLTSDSARIPCGGVPPICSKTPPQLKSFCREKSIEIVQTLHLRSHNFYFIPPSHTQTKNPGGNPELNTDHHHLPVLVLDTVQNVL